MSEHSKEEINKFLTVEAYKEGFIDGFGSADSGNEFSPEKCIEAWKRSDTKSAIDSCKEKEIANQ